MCGIIGYTGTGDSALDVLLTGLNGLEYRGYDSAGVALADDSLDIYKREGEVSALEAAVPEDPSSVSAGIGHTRWSTHGPPSDENAHPHTDEDSRIAVVHNGIIENYQELRDELATRGHEFTSDTDTEVVPHLIEERLAAGKDRQTAFRQVVDRLEGSYAIAAVFEGSDVIHAARHESPLVVGLGDEGNYLASDVPAFIEYTDRVIYLEDGEFATLTPDEVVVRDEAGEIVEPSIEEIAWDPEDAGKSGYDHYMKKEIHEQPRAIRNCLRNRIAEFEDRIVLEELADLERPTRIHLVACGTSYHAALYGAQLLREHGIPTQTFLASEYRAESVAVDAETLVIGVTQSGETADTMRALREASGADATTLAVTNTVGSSAARECDHVCYVRAGPEIGVAATKTFASQQVALAMVANALVDDPDPTLVDALRELPDQIQRVLDESQAHALADAYIDAGAYFFVGREYTAPVALEGALKMKEITYKHAEGFAAGELKHGPLALVEGALKMKEITYKHAEGFAAGELKHGPLALVTANTPVFALLTEGSRLEKTLGNVKEIQARDAPVIAVTDVPETVERYVDHVLEVPSSHPKLTPILANIQLQLASYWVANQLNRSIDKPRNLAKSVTVE
ncbi:glucosamine/fructose-6-phosphate aminotransferase [Natronococcus amylolyticus DSM 10524]|uniref:Glutamine--fructose-6-phosphate aminotransferase [isomerizing] n=1 Tax=Natronococcus amylolyticus DSM 10524 TaxID=1227497 RepID=L9WZP9_9EURY|nr:glutamine--fructose-6-phosphate transaminase (isomerizing) [Natronococcus amylolyticus]ELY54935.1 glucosamine/fructose-6-phosphate aminotransferase [Natronococcus amylolyticus DSM 10524]